MEYQENTNNCISGNITVQQTSGLFCLDSASLLMLKEQFYLFGQIQTSQTGGQLF